MKLDEELLSIVKKAYEQGLVVTIDQVSLPPYAMGHYYTRVVTRPSRAGRNYMLIHMDCPGFDDPYVAAAQLNLELK